MQKILKVILAVGLLAMAGSSPALSKAECNPADKIVANCSAIWKAIGLPDYTTTPSNKTAVCHDRYVLSHDNASKTPDWVVEVLNKAKLTNKFPRPKIKFSGDLCIPPEGQPDPGDYAKTADKFEIGHQAPSEDFNNSAVNMRDTFVFSNAVPQGGDTFNAGIWKTLETEVRKAAVARQTIYVITGPVRGSGGKRSISIAKADNACGGALDLEAFKTAMVCKAVNQKKATSCSSGVVVPVALYKIVYDPKKNAAYAFLMANRNYKTGLGRPFLEESRVNVGVIEKLTGLKFFSALPADKRASLIDKCEPTQLWAAATSAKKKKNRNSAHHLWNTKKAPAAISAKPKPWLQVIGSFR